MEFAKRLSSGLDSLSLPTSDLARAKLTRYVELIEKWNRTYNLTAIREQEKMLSHHILDSLAVIPYLSGTAVVDVGSGAGLPGIPLAIACDNWTLTLLDSNHKRTAFLQQARIELDLKNVEIVTQRVEQWQPGRRFDTVVSRAFSDLASFVQTSAFLCNDNGVVAVMKGTRPDEELAQLPAHAQVDRVIELNIPGVDAARHLVLIRLHQQPSEAL